METSIRTGVLVELVVAAILVLSPVILVLLPWKSRAGRLTASLMLVISVGVLALVAFVSDAVFGISGSWIFTLVVWGVGFGACLAVWLRHRSILSLALAVVVTTFIWLLHFMDVLPVKPYKRFFNALQVGMTEEEVMKTLHQEFPEGGRLPVPVRRDRAQNEIDFFLDPKESAWNAEGIFIHLSRGRVVSKQYSRD